MCSGHLPFFLHRFAAVWHMHGRFGRIPACRICKVAASYRPGPAESSLFRCPLGPVCGHICTTPRFLLSGFGFRRTRKDNAFHSPLHRSTGGRGRWLSLIRGPDERAGLTSVCIRLPAKLPEKTSGEMGADDWMPARPFFLCAVHIQLSASRTGALFRAAWKAFSAPAV